MKEDPDVAAGARLPSRPEISGRPAGTPDDVAHAERMRHAHERIVAEIGKLIVGQSDVIEQLLVAIFARGHCLVEGVPGLAKTAIISSLSRAMSLTFRRIQFTPDLMPSDITGTDIIQEDPESRQRRLVYMRGPIFAQMILADEINRTPPKTQAALLEAMQEGHVTIGDRTYDLRQPFFVLATQNPLEHEGTYPLPEAQQDRFMFHVKVAYPARDEEREILLRTTTAYRAEMEPVIDGASILACQEVVRKALVPDHVYDFVLDLARRTRPEESDVPDFVRQWVEWGAGPRASQFLVLGAKARAILQGRFHVTTEDVRALAAPVLRHRIRPNFNAESEGVTSDDIVARLLDSLA